MSIGQILRADYTILICDLIIAAWPYKQMQPTSVDEAQFEKLIEVTEKYQHDACGAASVWLFLS